MTLRVSGLKVIAPIVLLGWLFLGSIDPDQEGSLEAHLPLDPGPAKLATGATNDDVPFSDDAKYFAQPPFEQRRLERQGPLSPESEPRPSNGEFMPRGAGQGPGAWQGRGAGQGWERTPDRSEFPIWSNEPSFAADVFTFARIEYTSRMGGRGNRWRNDFPDSDWNFSYRLSELTTLKVDPDGRVIKFTDPDLFNFPFLFMNGVGSLILTQEEADALRRYLLNGGFLMVDDFWGEEEWENLMAQMDMVFPDREPTDLPLSHEIFHIVYDLKKKPQVPDIRTWRSGSTFEFNHGTPGDMLPHFQAYHDDHGRMVALLCHNNDLGDGWEREGENADYFETFSVPFSYPMGINIIAYAMSH